MGDELRINLSWEKSHIFFFRQYPLLCRKGHGILLFRVSDGFGCLKSQWSPLKHRPRRLRKGHGTEVFRDGSYSGFSLSLLIDCCDSDCKFEFKPLCVLFLFCCFEKHDIIICKVNVIILQIVGIALAVVIMPNKSIVMRGF